MPRAKVFISHIHENGAVAKALKDFIGDQLLNGVDTFVSSDGSISPGAPWQATIVARLRDSDIVIVICTNASIARPWINFEAGGALVKGATVVPVCWHGCTKAALPPPLGNLHAIDLDIDEDVRALMQIIATAAELHPKTVDVPLLRKMLPKRITESYDITPGMLLGMSSGVPQGTRIGREYGVSRRQTMIKIERRFAIEIRSDGSGRFEIAETVLHLEPLATDELKVFLYCRADQQFSDLRFQVADATLDRWERATPTLVAACLRLERRLRPLLPYTYSYAWEPPMTWGPDCDVVSVPIEAPTGLQEISIQSQIPIARCIAFKDASIATSDGDIAQRALLVSEYGCPPATMHNHRTVHWRVENPQAQNVYRLVLYYKDGKYESTSSSPPMPDRGA